MRLREVIKLANSTNDDEPVLTAKELKIRDQLMKIISIYDGQDLRVYELFKEQLASYIILYLKGKL